MPDPKVFNLVGKHVKWEKLEGKPYASMTERSGFGVLRFLDVECRMVIYGDYGVSTSPVMSITATHIGVKVVTVNSTYLVKE
jgi:hypothetical protein